MKAGGTSVKGVAMVAEIKGSPGEDAAEKEPAAPRIKRQYFPELQGIRAIAVLAVLVVHGSLTAGVLGFLNHPRDGAFAIIIERFCRESLPVLFALSGMLLYRPFALAALAGARSPNLRSYFWRRAIRIFPAYWLLVAIMLPVFNSNAIHGFWFLVRVETMQHVYKMGDIPKGMEQTWSMATETAFYVLLPIFAWAVDRWTRRLTDPAAKARRMLTAIMAIIVVSYVFQYYSHQPSLGFYPVQGNWPIGWFGYLAVGMALAVLSVTREVAPDRTPVIYRLIARRPNASWLAALVVLVLFCFSPENDQGTADYPKLGVTMFNLWIDLLIVALVLAPLTLPQEKPRLMRATLTARPLMFIAKISYSMFLWHIAILYWFNGTLTGNRNWFLTMAVVIGGSFLAACVSYYTVEGPALRLRSRVGHTTAKPSVAVLEKSPS